MKKFKVFRNTKGEAHAIKAGWCWPAFFFSFIWAVVSGMWVLGLGVFFTYAVFKALVGPSAVAEFYFSMILFITKIIFAINGNEWRAKSLVSKDNLLYENTSP